MCKYAMGYAGLDLRSLQSYRAGAGYSMSRYQILFFHGVRMVGLLIYSGIGYAGSSFLSYRTFCGLFMDYGLLFFYQVDAILGVGRLASRRACSTYVVLGCYAGVECIAGIHVGISFLSTLYRVLFSFRLIRGFFLLGIFHALLLRLYGYLFVQVRVSYSYGSVGSDRLSVMLQVRHFPRSSCDQGVRYSYGSHYVEIEEAVRYDGSGRFLFVRLCYLA